MARLFDLGQGSSVNDSVRLVSSVGELVTSGEKDMLYYREHGPERLVGKWSEHGRRARVIHNLETLETSNGIRTNVLQQKLGLVSRTTNTMLGLMQYPQGLGLVSHTTNMWLISNLQIDSSDIQIVQSDVLRTSIDTTATITNTLPWGCCIYQTKYVYYEKQITTRTSTPHLEPRAKSR